MARFLVVFFISLLCSEFVFSSAVESQRPWGNYALKDFSGLEYPEPVSWFPATIAWVFILIPICFFFFYKAYHCYRLWQKNAYRRSALAKLSAIALMVEQGDECQVGEIPVLLKAVALRSFARADVASLSGQQWLAFLETSCALSTNRSIKKNGPRFLGADGALLLALAYQPRYNVGGSNHTKPLNDLLKLCRCWVKHHSGSESAND